MTTTINASTSSGLVNTADTSGIIKVQSNGVTTNALAWVRFTGSTATINSSYNVSSITRSAVGNYLVTFTTALADANYNVVTGASNYSNGNQAACQIFSNAGTTTAPTTSNFYMTATTASAATFQDPTYVCATVFGN